MNLLAARLDGVTATGVPVDSRGLAYGDGLFETIAVHRGHPRLLDLHLERLLEGCARLGLAAPDVETLGDEVLGMAETPGCGVVKLLLFRGSGGRGYRPDPGAGSHRLLLAFPAPPAPPPALRLRLCETRLARQPALAGLKHLNRLEQVLARSEWDDPEIHEGLMLDTGGAVVEATQANLFLVQGGRLLTPDLSQCGVAGVMRRLILEHIAPRLALPVRVGVLRTQQLEEADEVLLSNSQYGVRPVVSLEHWRWSVGPVTRALECELTRIWNE